MEKDYGVIVSKKDLDTNNEYCYCMMNNYHFYLSRDKYNNYSTVFKDYFIYLHHNSVENQAVKNAVKNVDATKIIQILYYILIKYLPFEESINFIDDIKEHFVTCGRIEIQKELKQLLDIK